MCYFKFISAVPVVLLLVVTVAPNLLPVYGAAHRTTEQGSEGACPMCPYFINTPTNVTAPQGLPANLTCGVRNLVDRKVSWIRRKDLHVLTTGAFTYTTDGRFRVLHLEGSPYWTLEVGSPTINDSGVYECQVSTQPKIYRRFTLNVIVPSAEITGTQQLFMKAGSDINITCVIAGAVRGAPVTWYHVLPQPRNGVTVVEINIGERGGVQLVTDKNEGTSWLLVTHATWKDAGNYTCAPAYAKPASVSVHVLDEETPAAMQHDLQPSSGTPHHTLSISLLLLAAVVSLLDVLLFTTTEENRRHIGTSGEKMLIRTSCLLFLLLLLLLPGWIFYYLMSASCPTGFTKSFPTPVANAYIFGTIPHQLL